MCPSVAPDASTIFRNCFAQVSALNRFCFSRAVENGLKLVIATPGSGRPQQIANEIGASTRFPGRNLDVIVDFGKETNALRPY